MEEKADTRMDAANQPATRIFWEPASKLRNVE
jgi:hypothetical protein